MLALHYILRRHLKQWYVARTKKKTNNIFDLSSYNHNIVGLGWPVKNPKWAPDGYIFKSGTGVSHDKDMAHVEWEVDWRYREK